MITEEEFRIRQLPVVALLRMFESHQVEDWELLKGALSKILSYAAGFYDDYEYRHYEFALGLAINVLDGSRPEDVIQAMAATAYFMLNPCCEEAVEEAKGFSAETRACLERIRDTHPDFAELAAEVTS